MSITQEGYLDLDRQDLIDNYKYFIKSNFTNISKEEIDEQTV